MSLKKTLFLILPVFFASMIFTSVKAAETDEFRLTSSPLPINLKVDPGSSISAQIKIKNDGTKTENIKVGLMKFKADENTGAPILLEREHGDDYFDWVSFSEDKFSLPANEWKTITANFNVPSTASFGYYYAVVFSRAEENIQKGERQTVLTGGTATLVLLEAKVPNAKREVSVETFSVNKKMFEFLPATFNIKLKNTGNVHIVPVGNIFISRGDEQDIAIIDVNPNKGSILPNSPRSFEEQWSDGFPFYTDKKADGKVVLDENGNAVKELKWNFSEVSKLRWGKYTAKMVMIYNDGNIDVPVEGEVSFWVIPWRVIAGGLLVSIFVVIGLKSTLQKFYIRIKGFFSKNK